MSASEDHLYELPVADFTAARNELAAQLRRAGDREAAEAVKRLSKPSLTAWALNQVSRARPELVAVLLETGATLALAQRGLLAGAAPGQFHDAVRAEREAVNQVLRAATGVLEASGHSAGKATVDRLEASLHASAAGGEAADLLRAGRLAGDVDPPGFDGFEAFGSPGGAPVIPLLKRSPASPAASGARPAARESGQEETKRAEQRAEARRAVSELRRQLSALTEEAARAESQAAVARQEALKAEHAVDAARRALDEAHQRARQAQTIRGRLEEALTQARAELDRANADLRAAEARLLDAK